MISFTPRLLPLPLAAGALVVSLAACGDDSSGTLESIPGTDTVVAAPTTPAPAVGPTTIAPLAFEHPMGADDVVARIAYEGGFVPVETMFLNLPTLLVTGDGRVIVPGAVPAIYPGPLLPSLQVGSIGEDGVQQLLSLAADHGLLTPRTYETDMNIADAPDTVVTIVANGETIEHRAYALGLGGEPETDPLRAELAAFVDAATRAASDGSIDLQPYASDTFLLRAAPVSDLSVYDPEPTVVAWPAEAPALDGAADCLSVPADTVGEAVASADQLTFFTSGDVTYSVAVKPLLPGDSCPAG
jgi:hypothetical protein